MNWNTYVFKISITLSTGNSRWDVLQACKQLNEDYGAMCITTPDVAKPVSVSEALDKIANYYCG